MPYRGRPAFRLRYGNPLLLEDMLVEFPDLKVYMMHAGGAGPFSEYALMMMSMYPQLHTDVGVLSWMPGLEGVLESFLRRAQAMGMLDRVMFGSDQMVWPEAIGLAVERINALDFLSVDEKADIFYNNAARFLGLSEETIAQNHDAAGRKRAAAMTRPEVADCRPPRTWRSSARCRRRGGAGAPGSETPRVAEPLAGHYGSQRGELR